jgi:GTP cyclohydrolase FolE2
MNAPEGLPLADIQAGRDFRDVRIDRVGVKDLRYPVTVRSGERIVATTGTWSLTVELPGHVKGTHMSRFIEVLEAHSEPFDKDVFHLCALRMLRRLDAESGVLEVSFPYFARKLAPVSRAVSLVDYDVKWTFVLRPAEPGFRMKVAVPATSLCPCSKEISAYGAHNQRSHITIDAEVTGDITIEDIVAIAERSASCEVYGLLKRADEKFVTERAYDNPKFVEDIVRDVALVLDRDRRIGACIVEAENFESIHNHSAYARIVRRAKS